MQRSEEYWARRAWARMDEAQRTAQENLASLSVPYRRAQAALMVQIRAIQDRYMRRYGVTEEEARKILSEPADAQTLKELERAVKAMPEGREKRRMQAQLNAPATRWRISNLQAMRERVRAITEALSDREQRMVTDSLTRAVRENYLKETYDLQRRAEVLWEPQGLSDRFVRQTLREDWSGANYKTRINRRYDELAKKVQESVAEGLLGGRNRNQMAEEIAHEFGASYRDAKRLLTTETTYVVNAAHAERFREHRIGEYRIVAVLDLKTSDICQEQDGKIYPTAEAEAGKNLPPFHPNCRSTVIAVISREWLEQVERKARDPVTGEEEKVPPGMTYPEWLKRLEERYGKEKIDALRKAEKEKTTRKNEEAQWRIEQASERQGRPESAGELLQAEGGNDKITNREILHKRIEAGEITTTIYGPTQRNHMASTRAKGKSYFENDMQELQTIINERRGTGEIMVFRSGQIKESIEDERIRAKNVDLTTTEETPTHRCTIHYGKRRTHIVPTKEREP